MSPLTGGCACGAMRFEAGEVTDAGFCHCSICRRLAGPAAAWANVEGFRMTRGEPKVFASSDHGRRSFCSGCGTYLFYQDVSVSYASLNVAALDDPEAVKPSLHLFEAQQPSWLRFDDGLPRYAALPQPEDPAT